MTAFQFSLSQKAPLDVTIQVVESGGILKIKPSMIGIPDMGDTILLLYNDEPLGVVRVIWAFEASVWYSRPRNMSEGERLLFQEQKSLGQIGGRGLNYFPWRKNRVPAA